MLAILGVTTVSAQSTKIYQYQETEARAMDVWSNAYVKPLTVELKVKGNRTGTMVDIPADKKFMIYKDIIMLTEDKACIEPAYNAARQIMDEKAKGEALVYIVECIDKLGIQMSIGGDQ